MARSERLFERVERVDEQEAQTMRKRRGPLAYLQCSKRPEVVQRCEWYEEWFAQYPQGHKPKLKSDLIWLLHEESPLAWRAAATK